MRQNASAKPQNRRQQIADIAAKFRKKHAKPKHWPGSDALRSTDTIDDGRWLQAQGIDPPLAVATPALRALAKRQHSETEKDADNPVFQFLQARTGTKNKPTEIGKLTDKSVFTRLLRPAHRDAFLAFMQLRLMDLPAGAPVDIDLLDAHTSLSRSQRYAALQHPVFRPRRVAHNKYRCVMPDIKQAQRDFDISGSARRLQSVIDALSPGDLRSIQDLEAAFLRVRVEEKPGKHAMAGLAAAIHRSVSTARERIKRLGDLITVTPNYIELAVASARHAIALMAANADRLAFWYLEFRHRWRPTTRRALAGYLFKAGPDGVKPFEALLEKGYEAIAIRQTVNSYHIEA